MKAAKGRISSQREASCRCTASTATAVHTEKLIRVHQNHFKTRAAPGIGHGEASQGTSPK